MQAWLAALAAPTRDVQASVCTRSVPPDKQPTPRPRPHSSTSPDPRTRPWLPTALPSLPRLLPGTASTRVQQLWLHQHVRRLIPVHVRASVRGVAGVLSWVGSTTAQKRTGDSSVS